MTEGDSLHAGIGGQAKEAIYPTDNDRFLKGEFGRDGGRRGDIERTFDQFIGALALPFPAHPDRANQRRIFGGYNFVPLIDEAGHGEAGLRFIFPHNGFGRPGDDFCDQCWSGHRFHGNHLFVKPQKVIQPLLEWYGKHKRDLPWRSDATKLGRDPYRVWLSEIMLQQTTVPAVAPYYAKFLRHYPTVEALAKAPNEDVMRDWAGLGYYSRARNLHACAKVVAANGGKFPRSIEALKELPGIGDYTAAAIASIAFDQKASVVDGNVDRVVTRLYAIKTPLPASKREIRARAAEIYFDDANVRPGDLPQAFMDLGATICTPAKPKCASCPVQKVCEARKAGIQNELPRREAKKARPKRKGFVYWVRDTQGRVLAQRRPDKGLLGGMAGLPTSEWNDDPAHLKDFKIERFEKEKVKHVFTHFELSLVIAISTVKKIPDGYYFTHPEDAGFPSVFSKVVKALSRA